MKLRPARRLNTGQTSPNLSGIPAPIILTLETRQTADGRRVLYFPFISVSDIHWGTKYSKAKKLAQFFGQTSSDTLMLVGDIIDGEALVEKERWNFGPWHRQGIAHVIRKAGAGTRVIDITGNHDEELRGKTISHTDSDGQVHKFHHRKMTDKTIYGIEVKDSHTYQDPRGRNILGIHGDQFDGVMFKDAAEKKRWYKRGDGVLHALYDFDLWLRKIPGLQNFSIAAAGKSIFKSAINLFWNIDRTVESRIDRSGYDGVLYGHSHMPRMKKTAQGKLIINDGSCIEHVQAAVHDRHGNWALIEWHKKHIDILMESGHRYSVPVKDLALSPAMEQMIEDDATQKADRLLRLAYRLWPAKNRQRDLAVIQTEKAQLAQMKKDLDEVPNKSNRQIFYNVAQGRLLRHQDRYLQIPIQRQTGHRTAPDCKIS